MELSDYIETVKGYLEKNPRITAETHDYVKNNLHIYSDFHIWCIATKEQLEQVYTDAGFRPPYSPKDEEDFAIYDDINYVRSVVKIRETNDMPSEEVVFAEKELFGTMPTAYMKLDQFHPEQEAANWTYCFAHSMIRFCEPLIEAGIPTVLPWAAGFDDMLNEEKVPYYKP